MPLTKHFKSTILNRAHQDIEFRRSLLTEALNELFLGDMEVGKSMLRDYIHATIAFEVLAKELNKNTKSVQRMLGASGNPTTKSLVSILHVLEKMEGIKIHISIQ